MRQLKSEIVVLILLQLFKIPGLLCDALMKSNIYSLNFGFSPYHIASHVSVHNFINIPNVLKQCAANVRTGESDGHRATDGPLMNFNLISIKRTKSVILDPYICL